MPQTTRKTNYISSTTLDKCFWTKVGESEKIIVTELLKHVASCPGQRTIQIESPNPGISSHKLEFMF